jgi:PAS domain S-box-containing protein
MGNTITDINPAAEKITGLKKSAIIEKSLIQVWPELARWKPSTRFSQPWTIIFEIEGYKKYLEISITPVAGRQGNLGGELIMLHDITELEQAQDAIKRKMAIEETVARISTRFVGSFNLDKDITSSLADIGTLCRSGRAYLFLINKDLNEMTIPMMVRRRSQSADRQSPAP